VPGAAVIHRAYDLLSNYLPGSDEIDYEVTETIRFIDQGENWERVLCPVCGTELDTIWWQEAMDTAYQLGFTDLLVNLPCCSAVSSLNDLQYEWPAGFARFTLEARNPGTDLNDDELKLLEQVLGCKLRKIWAHY
ncbi:MAG: hypothetical protein SVX38_11190, partial [Chloroflexota bacterium]|nr:hypothetical protein [Chloroflexota bacterium]